MDRISAMAYRTNNRMIRMAQQLYVYNHDPMKYKLLQSMIVEEDKLLKLLRFWNIYKEQIKREWVKEDGNVLVFDEIKIVATSSSNF